MRPPHEPSLSAFPYQLDSTKRISWNGRDLSARFNARISLQCGHVRLWQLSMAALWQAAHKSITLVCV